MTNFTVEIFCYLSNEWNDQSDSTAEKKWTTENQEYICLHFTEVLFTPALQDNACIQDLSLLYVSPYTFPAQSILLNPKQCYSDPNSG